MKTAVRVACAVVAAISVAACSGGGGGGSSSAKVIYASATTGADANGGTYDRPVRTLTHAVALAGTGGIVQLLPGTYDLANGESYPLSLPDAITITGSGAVTKLSGAPNVDGLIFSGRGAVAGLDIAGFQNVFTMTKGEQLLDGLRVTGSRVVVSASGTASTTVSDSAFEPTYEGVSVDGPDATVRMDGGSISGLPNACFGGEAAFEVSDGRVEILSVDIHDNFGAAIELRGTAAATVDGGSIIGNGYEGCGNSESMSVAESASLGLYGTTVSGYRGPVLIDYTFGTPTVSHPTIDISASDLSSAGSGSVILEQNQANVKIRGSHLSGASYAIIVSTDGASVGALDLGTAADPGENVIQGNSIEGLSVSGTTGSMTIQAAGNFWTPNVQGANGQGEYATTVVSGPTSGPNFSLQTAAQSIQF
jgi:hypothetical protein